MASYELLPNGKIRAYVHVNGKRQSKTLLNKRKAQSWTREKEYELSQQTETVNSKITVAQLFQRYAEEISPTKKGGHWELIRLQKFQRDDELCRHKLIDLKREHLEDWIAERL